MKMNIQSIKTGKCWRTGLSLLVAAIQMGWGQVELANSETEFSGVQGQDDWSYGYRNLTADGGMRDYDATADFIEFTTAEFDADLNKWDLGANAPWTEVGARAVHPNGSNNTNEHWAIRRWTAPVADVAVPTLVSVEWFVGADNTGGSGVTGQLHLNGALNKAVPIAGNDATGVTTLSFLTVSAGDQVDLALTPVGLNGDPGDGSDGSFTSMIITTVVDSDGDLLADSWEELYFPGDLTKLNGPMDFDSDGLTDGNEFDLGSDPTLVDTDGDGLEDSWETNDGIFDSATDTGSSPTLADTDGDGISDGDEVNGTPPTNPSLIDTDGDGYSDPLEITLGSDPTLIADTPLSEALADSREDFSGVDGSAGLNKGTWRWGYRNLALDGGSTNYDAAADFIPFPVDGSDTRSSTNFWNGNSFDWADDTGANINPPWTALGLENTHPNGTNNAEEHWTVRRWTASDLGATTPVRVVWHTRKANANGNGVTGSIHLNGVEADSRTIAGGDATGFIRFHYFNLEDGDIIDLVLTPEGTTDRLDGSDGSANWMTIDTRIPAVPINSNGKYFIPVGSEDSDADEMADFWELEYFPGDLTQLVKGADFDADGLNNEDEQANGTDPTNPDSDSDGVPDGLEVALGSNPCKDDSDGDGFGDRQEVATGFDPADPADNVQNSPVLVADSVADFPDLVDDPQGLNGWDYGYYNTSLNGDPTGSASFIPFPTDGTQFISADNFWTGTIFDFIDAGGAATNPPWTTIAAATGHPNGDNSGEVHWTTRRWKVAESRPLALSYALRKVGMGGNGTTAVVLQNGVPLDEITVGGTDGTGTASWYFVNAAAGDYLEVALTPKGLDDSNADGVDSSAFRLWIDGRIPQNPVQPDGSPFVPGASLDAFRVTEISYNKGTSQLTLKFTTRDSFEYQVEQLTATNPVTWTPVGPTFSPDPGGETEATLNSITDERAIFHVRELVP